VAPTPAEAKPRYGGILLRVQDSDPESFDPYQETGGARVLAGAVGAIGNGILQFDPVEQDKVVGDLAERWEVNPDGKVYTFYFHKGIKWHDGTAFSADDVKFILDRISKPPKGMVSPRQGPFQVIESIEVVDKDTLRIVLQYPSASFLQVLATGWNIIMPRHVVEPAGVKRLSYREAVGSGPFKIKEFISGVSLEWAKNEDYFIKGRPYLDGMKMFFIRDGAAQHAAFKTGKIHVSYLGGTAILPSDVAAIKRMRPETVVQKGLTLYMPNLGMNTKRKPFDDARVRKAIFLAVDRQAGNQVIQQGEGLIGGLFPPTSYWAFPQDELLRMPGYRQPKDQDLAEAKRLMAEAGYPSGFKSTLLARPDKLNQDIAVFFANEVSKLGIEAQIQTKEIASFVASMNGRNFDLFEWAQAIVIDDPDMVFGEFYTSSGVRNYEQHVVPGLEEMFDKQSRELDPAKRKETVLQMQRLVLENPAKAIAIWHTLFVLFAPEVKGYKVGNRGTYQNAKFQDVWLAQ
ncbi:MAG: ABC transporter substrate-binding protein, partial [Chloroflexota bacterium]|nr:ABC transporter substrate-binding protein [Chloroflexota bacterium]